MTTPKVNTIKRGGSRFYVEPDSGVKVPGVTSVIGMLPKDFLRYWAAKEVAQTAVDELGTVVSMVLRDPSAAVDHLKKAPDRNTRKAADIGTAAHDLFERMARGENLGRVHPDLEIYVRHYEDFMKQCNPEFHFMEETVWSDSRGEHLAYAGSFDFYGEIDGQRLWGDNKTTRSGVHAEVGIQLAAYRFADHILRSDGSRVPMPKAEGGVVVHVRPEGWKLVPVKADEESFEVFLKLREIFNYVTEGSKGMIGKPAYEGPNETTTGPKRRTAAAPSTRKAPARKVPAPKAGA